MCVRVNCDKCGKASWAGCGAHVDQVLAGVPKDKRCTCPRVAAAPAIPKWLLTVLVVAGVLFALRSMGV